VLGAWKGGGQLKDSQIEIEALLAAIIAYLLDHYLEDLVHKRLFYELGCHHDQARCWAFWHPRTLS
jgi:hypothetical protein